MINKQLMMYFVNLCWSGCDARWSYLRELLNYQTTIYDIKI